MICTFKLDKIYTFFYYNYSELSFNNNFYQEHFEKKLLFKILAYHTIYMNVKVNK